MTGSGEGSEQREVSLRAEVDGPDSRYLWAYLDEDGNLHIDGQDLGPKTAPVSSDGEYEWFQTIKKGDLPKLIALLGGEAVDDILDLLEQKWTGPKAGALEAVIRESGIEVERFVS